LRSSSCFIIWL